MAKGIFVALEDLEEASLTVEPVDEGEYIQAQNDLDDHSDAVDDLCETYENADQDANTIEAVADSIPDTDESPVESTIIATEALIRKLGLPHYSLESYKHSTNRALKASLEETVEKTNEAKKSLFKKIWEKIVAFFKKAYAFITGLFKKKAKDVKKKVDDLDINSAEEGIKRSKESNKELLEHLYNLYSIEEKDGKMIYQSSKYRAFSLFIDPKEIVTIPKVEHSLNNLEGIFKEVNSTVDKLSHLSVDSEELEAISENIEKINNEFSDHFSKYLEKRNFHEDEVSYIEIPTKHDLQSLLDKVDNFSKKVADLEKKVLVILEKFNPEDFEYGSLRSKLYKIGKIKYIVKEFNDFIKACLEYSEKSTYILESIEKYSK